MRGEMSKLRNLFHSYFVWWINNVRNTFYSFIYSAKFSLSRSKDEKAKLFSFPFKTETTFWSFFSSQQMLFTTFELFMGAAWKKRHALETTQDGDYLVSTLKTLPSRFPREGSWNARQDRKVSACNNKFYRSLPLQATFVALTFNFQLSETEISNRNHD